jgi:hypothetical protein
MAPFVATTPDIEIMKAKEAAQAVRAEAPPTSPDAWIGQGRLDPSRPSQKSQPP